MSIPYPERDIFLKNTFGSRKILDLINLVST